MLISSLESVDESTFIMTTSLFKFQISTLLFPLFLNFESNSQRCRCSVVGTGNCRTREGGDVESGGMRCH